MAVKILRMIKNSACILISESSVVCYSSAMPGQIVINVFVKELNTELVLDLLAYSELHFYFYLFWLN